MTILLFWLVFSILVGVYADKKGRSGIGFFFLALILSPLVGFIVAALSDTKNEKVAQQSGIKKCPDCAEYVQADARVCRFCGYRFTEIGVERAVGEGMPSTPDVSSGNASISSESGTIQEKGRPRLRVMMAAFSIVAIFVVLALSLDQFKGGSHENQPATTPPSQAPAPRSPQNAFSIGNPANDKMLALLPSEQASALGDVVKAGCVGNRAFYMGMSRKDHSAYWSVGCTNGKSYEVEIHADQAGSTRVLDCAILKLVAKVSCFVRFSDQ